MAKKEINFKTFYVTQHIKNINISTPNKYFSEKQ